MSTQPIDLPFRLIRTGGPDLEFDGRILAHANNKAAARPRWIERTVYVTRAGSYVLYKRGCSRVEGETDRGMARIVLVRRTPEETFREMTEAAQEFFGQCAVAAAALRQIDALPVEHID